MRRLIVLSVVAGTICCLPEPAGQDAAEGDTVLVSHTGVPLIRATTFRFTLDVNHANTSGCWLTRARSGSRSTTRSGG